MDSSPEQDGNGEHYEADLNLTSAAPAATTAKSSVPRQFIGAETAADLTTLTNLETLLTNPPRRRAATCPCCTKAPTSLPPSPTGRGGGSERVATYALAYQRQMLARRKSQQATYAALRRLLMTARSETLKNLANADLTPDTEAAATSGTESGTQSGMGGSPMRSEPEPSPQSETASSAPIAAKSPTSILSVPPAASPAAAKDKQDACPTPTLATKAAAATIAFDRASANPSPVPTESDTPASSEK